MAASFIGKPISLISHSDIRYRGTLQGIDPIASTIQLENVYYMGTETRRPPEEYVPPKQEPFAYIVFRASEVKDLAVDDSGPPLATSVHDDPAVLGASPAVAPNYPPYNNQQNQQAHPARQPQSIQAVSSLAPVPGPAIREIAQNRPQPSRPQQSQHQGGNRSRPNPVSSANAAVEQVERAMSDLRVNGSGPISSYRGGRGGSRRGRGGGRMGDGGAEQIRVPTTDFDFESANAKFDKTAVAKASKSDEDSNTSDDGAGPVESATKGAYDPKSSFFDEISTSASTSGGPGGTRGRRGGGAVSSGRTRRDEEREKNFVTFGETGGAGLLGRGDHIAGWNGYGRRGGGRPRRGTPRGGANAQAAAARG